MRAIVTGQVGVDKGPYLEAVKQPALKAGHDLEVCHVGKMMYEEAPDVPAGRILNLPISRLNTLRRAVFKEILRTADKHEHIIVNTHATFRWRHGLFAAFDYDQIKQFNADLYLTLLDNADDLPVDVREPEEEGLPVVPHEPRDGPPGHAQGDRRVPRRAGRPVHRV